MTETVLAHPPNDGCEHLAGGASIINIANIAAFVAVPIVPGYGAAKAGIVQTTKNLRSPVRYILLPPGHVDHVGRVDLFREAGTEVIAQANNAAQQAYDARLAPFRTRRSQDRRCPQGSGIGPRS